jgi:hypothetical protein
MGEKAAAGFERKHAEAKRNRDPSRTRIFANAASTDANALGWTLSMGLERRNRDR